MSSGRARVEALVLLSSVPAARRQTKLGRSAVDGGGRASRFHDMHPEDAVPDAATTLGLSN